MPIARRASQTSPRILGIGSPIIDYILPIPDSFLTYLPGGKGGSIAIDETAFSHLLDLAETSPFICAGGSAANTVKALAALGANTTFFGKIGRDREGDLFLASMKKYRVVCDCLPAKRPTGKVLSLVTDDGERTQRSLLGAVETLTESDIEPSLFLGHTHLHIESYLLRNGDVVLKSMRTAKEKGLTISFDLGSYEIVHAFRKKLLSLLEDHVDLVIGNADEAWALFETDPASACRLLQKLVTTSVILVGKNGCWVGEENHVANFPSPFVKAIDTTGAGDFFIGGFLYGYLHNFDHERSATLGNLLGSTVVQFYGAEIPLETFSKFVDR